MNHKKGALDRFIKANKNKYENIGNGSLNEQVNNVEIYENEFSGEVLLVNEQDYIDSQTQNENKTK